MFSRRKLKSIYRKMTALGTFSDKGTEKQHAFLVSEMKRYGMAKAMARYGMVI